MIMKNPLVIYSDNYTDGFSAAWAIWTKHPDWEFQMHEYGNPYPDVTDRKVYIVGIACKRFDINKLAMKARSINIIDHHDSTVIELEDGFDNKHYCPVVTYIDTEHSSTVLAWKLFHPDEYVPNILLHVEDRNLGRNTLKDNKYVIAALQSYSRDFSTWTTLVNTFLYDIIEEGKAISNWINNQAKALVDIWCKNPRYTWIGGNIVPIINCNQVLATEVCKLLIEYTDNFVAVFWHNSESITYSLRSANSEYNVKNIALKYNGGGSNNSAGFVIEGHLPLSIFYLGEEDND